MLKPLALLQRSQSQQLFHHLLQSLRLVADVADKTATIKVTTSDVLLLRHPISDLHRP